MWRLVFVFALLILALDRIPALWVYLFRAQICFAHRFPIVLVKSITIVEGNVFERLLENCFQQSLECEDETLPALCDFRPVVYFDKKEFQRCFSSEDSHFVPYICDGTYEYPSDFNCPSYHERQCNRGRNYIYACVCRNKQQKSFCNALLVAIRLKETPRRCDDFFTCKLIFRPETDFQTCVSAESCPKVLSEEVTKPTIVKSKSELDYTQLEETNAAFKNTTRIPYIQQSKTESGIQNHAPIVSAGKITNAGITLSPYLGGVFSNLMLSTYLCSD
ncbi:unnamed protein product [Thelazia callipaeda]|uniref:Chitin-binding type-2 domain-containing protein n=1 Tax=Thelazia callipaeda TaxID=103827 RepID=A0A0N5CSC0_THECL|nr:unnamed protein product [Thelazia callipaeda]